MRLRRYAIAWLLLLLPTLGRWLLTDESSNIVGLVFDDQGPVAEALVRWQGDSWFVRTDRQGSFALPGVSDPTRRIVTSKPGYRIASANSASKPLRLLLTLWPQQDEQESIWIEPGRDATKPMQCGNCHAEIEREWAQSAHGQAATNPKFLSFYASDHSWTVLAEHPLGASVCASCHVPTLESPTLEYDPRQAKGASKAGVHCDFCHKIVDAPIDRLGTRFGRDGLRLLRPASGEQFFLGPLDDAVRPGESFAALPLYRESRYCASCHEGIVFGVHAYSTYSEWLESPAFRLGRQCQDCHMKPTGTLTNLAPGKGGISRDPSTLASHALPGNQVEMLRQGLRMKIKPQHRDDGIEITMELHADQVGHRVPTGFIDRQLLLVVSAWDDQGRPLPLLEGLKLPSSVGSLADQAGWLYAQQLEGESHKTPIPFWRPVVKLTDTRLDPRHPDQRRFRFALQTRRVEVRLLYRRFWEAVARERGWTDNETIIFSETVEIK